MNGINNINVNDSMSQVIEAQNNQHKVKHDPKGEITNKLDKQNKPAAVYEKGNNKKAGHVYDKDAIAGLKRQTEENKAKIIKLVTDSLNRQGKKHGIANKLPGFAGITNIDAQARKEAEALIAEDGELGINKTSDRLVDFAIALSGGDKSKASVLRDAIDKGFKEAERMFGGKLPKISYDTYDKTMEKFDAYFSEKETTENVEKPEGNKETEKVK